MNEEKLRKKMNQRKEALEQEREELLRDSLKLSNKCNGEQFIHFFFFAKIINKNLCFRVQRKSEGSCWVFRGDRR